MTNVVSRPGIGLVAALALAVSGSAQASTLLLSENFDGATPGLYSGAISGITSFATISGNIDVIGTLHGSNYTCPGGSGNNCIDLSGLTPGAIGSTSAFNLMAGYAYKVTFDLAPSPNYSYKARVSLGSHSEDFIANQGTGFVQMSMVFMPASSEPSAKLTFQSIGMGQPGYWGPELDNVMLTQTAPVPVPETYGIFLAGLGGLGVVRRRKVAARA